MGFPKKIEHKCRLEGCTIKPTPWWDESGVADKNISYPSFWKEWHRGTKGWWVQPWQFSREKKKRWAHFCRNGVTWGFLTKWPKNKWVCLGLFHSGAFIRFYKWSYISPLLLQLIFRGPASWPPTWLSNATTSRARKLMAVLKVMASGILSW